jgi:protein involved in polysaccharide export with SLBB domain
LAKFSVLVAVLAWSLGASAQTQTGAANLAVGSVDATAINPPTVTAPAALGHGLNGKPNTNQFEAVHNPFDNAQDAAPANKPKTREHLPNQFQRFVQQSTGRLLPVFGADLFDSPQAYSANSAAPAPDNYVLGPGDEVQLQVTGPQDFGSLLVLDRNGQVNLPKVGAITLAGVAVRDLEKTLASQLGKVFTNIKVNAAVGRLRGIQVYVVGQAQQPGTYQVSSVSTLVNALFASGGPSANGSMRSIELKRASQTITTFDLYDFIAKGDKSHDVPLLAGDVIVIPPVGPRVAVTGAFDQAAIYELKPGATSIADILNLGGGVPAMATEQKLLLERITRSSSPPRQVQEVVLNASGLGLPLQDGDVLTLLGISQAFANAVTLQGVVAAPLRYRWFEGMHILDLIPERDALITGDYYKRKNMLVQNADVAQTAGGKVDERMRGMVDQINWEYAVIERLDRSQLSTQLIPFNLGRAVLQKDPAHNLPLLAGDVVTILSQNDLRLPQERQSRLVRVEGEVAAPGVYQASPGETLPQLIKRIGGLTPQAYLFGTEFNRESVKKRQQENLDALIRRLESQTQAQQSNTVANRNSNGTADQTAAVLQLQQAQLKSQIDRLKSFKSNGRVALELDPNGHNLATLPDLPLEDGDRIAVPSTPGFVSAFGSVNNENVFIYKPGKTVADVIKSAGLTEDAEPAQAFVLRADGSIIARNNSGGFFGGGFESVAMMPGDTLVVPAQMDRESRYNAFIRGAKDWTQIMSNFGIAAAGLKSLGY